jgi:phosphohistidine phosphatase SixA
MNKPSLLRSSIVIQVYCREIAVSVVVFLLAIYACCAQPQPRFEAMPDSAGGLRQCRTIIIVRHADRNGRRDELTTNGTDRANILARILSQSRVSWVFASPSNRTVATAMPLVRGLKLTNGNFETNAFCQTNTGEQIVQKIGKQIENRNQTNGVILIVCHHEQIQDLVMALGHKCETIQQDEFDKIFLIIPTDGGRSRFIELRYGKATGQDTGSYSGRVTDADGLSLVLKRNGVTF